MSAIDDAIAELIESFRNGEVCVFAGAGISRNSGLPVVEQLVPELLSQLNVSEEDIKSLMASKFCFEELMQIIFECSKKKEDAELFFNLFREGAPNLNHIFLAKLVRRGYLQAIVTTNFDLLIEKALEGQRLKRGKRFEVFHTEEDFACIDWNDGRPCVFKIHGSIENSKAMAITLRQVARQELSSQRREIIKRVFSTGKHKIVLVLGYSSSDVFDISPHIATLEGERKRVILVEHCTDTRVEPLSLRSERNPFRRFEGSQRLYYDTDLLVKTLWSSLLEDKWPRFEQGTTRWKEHVAKWSWETYFSGLLKDFTMVGPEIAGRIFYAISDFKTAAKYFHLAERYAYMDDKKRMALDSILGDIYVRLGDMETAVMTYYSQAIKMADKLGAKKNLVALLISAGDLFYENGKPKEAAEYYAQASLKAARTRDWKQAALANAQLGNAWNDLGDYGVAAVMLKKALKTADKMGDIRTKAAILGYLGDNHELQGESQQALNYYEQALEADRHLGHKRGEMLHHSKIADAYIGVKSTAKALEHLKGKLKIAEGLEDDVERTLTFAVMASIYSVTGEYHEAVAAYQEALKGATELKEREPAMMWEVETDALIGLGNCYMELKEHRKAIDAYESGRWKILGNKRKYSSVLYNLGILYEELKEYEDAARCFEEALSSNRKLEERDAGVSKEEVETLINLGVTRGHQGEHQKAIDIYEEGLQIARRIPDKQKEGLLLFNLGKASYDLGQYAKSIEYSEQALALLQPLLGDNHSLTRGAATNLLAAKKKLQEE